MNWKTILVVFVLLDFGALSGYALYTVGYIGIFEAALANWGTMQLFADLVIACSLACIWMYTDARSRDMSPWPFIVITLFAGSFGPLLYLLRRETAGATALAQPA